MPTKPQDIFVALKLCLGSSPKTYGALAESLVMSVAEVHAAVRRLAEARLLDAETRAVLRAPFFRYLLHGVPYSFPARLGAVTRGIPTAWAAPCLGGIVLNGQLPPIWPHPEGKVQGSGLAPLYRSVPEAAGRDEGLYELLSLVECLRIGRAREKALAEKTLALRILHAVAVIGDSDQTSSPSANYPIARKSDLPPQIAGNPHVGESLDEFLQKEGLLDEFLENEDRKPADTSPESPSQT